MVQTNSLKKLLIIAGPTAVGKTSFGIKCANMFNGEIISADCEQIYHGLNIGSAKPTKEEQNMAKHHLIDCVSPQDSFSVAEFKQQAQSVINYLQEKNKLPIVVGGTGLYIQSLLFPMQLGNSQKNENIRQKYDDLAQKYGKEYVFDLLKKVDIKSAEKLHPNDLKRVVRALEIYDLTGKPKSEQRIDRKSEYDYKLVFLNDDRDALYDRINARVEQMFDAGLEQEVKSLLSQGITKQNQCMQGIGYKEFFDYFDGLITKKTLIEKIKQNSRNYAKRQITWFRHMPKAEEYNTKEQQKILQDISLWLKN